jgi:hypothetical protein
MQVYKGTSTPLYYYVFKLHHNAHAQRYSKRVSLIYAGLGQQTELLLLER